MTTFRNRLRIKIIINGVALNQMGSTSGWMVGFKEVTDFERFGSIIESL